LNSLSLSWETTSEEWLDFKVAEGERARLGAAGAAAMC